jgi:aspartyl/asparaginyl-tRNA synthetase
VGGAGLGKDQADAKEFSFLEVNDGSCLVNLQVIIPRDLPSFSLVSKVTQEAVWSTGELVESRVRSGNRASRQRGRCQRDCRSDIPCRKRGTP